MSSGFDDRVEARLIGLRMATDTPNGLDGIVTRSSNLTLSNETSQETDNRNSLFNQSPTSSVFTSLSSNSSSINNNNAPVTARR